MGSNLSCVKKKPGQAVPADDGCDVDGHAYSTTTDYHGPPNSVVSLTPPPSTASKHHQPVENQYSNCSSGNDDANHHNNNTDKPKHPTRSVPVLPPLAADTKLAKTDDSKPGLNKPNMAIVHDQNGYALVIPKSGSNFDAAAAAATTNGNTRTSSSSAGQSDSPVACNAGNNKNGKNATAGVKTVKADDKIKPSQTDTGAYCNVVLAGDLGTRSFSNDLYDDTDMQVPAPKLPESTRNVVKIADSKENSQNSQLNYIQVEFVNPSDETSKAHLKPDRSNTPTQYSDVINDNGVVRVMT